MAGGCPSEACSRRDNFGVAIADPPSLSIGLVDASMKIREFLD